MNKSLIISFWIKSRDGDELPLFKLNHEVADFLQENNVMNFFLCTTEFLRKEGFFLPYSQCERIEELTFQLVFTSKIKANVTLLVISEDLKEPFLKKIGYHEEAKSDEVEEPSIVDIYVQDKKNLEDGYEVCCIDVHEKKARYILRTVLPNQGDQLKN